MNLQGKVALVTGGAHRVGKAITMMLASAGAHVVINYHSSEDAALATAAEVSALGVLALPVQCDVAEEAEVDLMARQILAQFGGVDIVINAASHFARTPLFSEQPGLNQTWRTVTRVLIDGPWYIANALAPSLKQRNGAIVNIIDIAGLEPWRGFAAHSVGKAALLALTRQLALELAPEVRVNAVAPGNVLPPPNMPPDRVAAATQRILLERWGTPTDVTAAVRYLLEADFVTGETLVVDGGERLWRRK